MRNELTGRWLLDVSSAEEESRLEFYVGWIQDRKAGVYMLDGNLG